MTAMTHIKIKKGLDIPIAGKPEGYTQSFHLSEEPSSTKTPSRLALNLQAFEDIKFRLLAKVGDKVKIGQPLAEDKDCFGRFFVSPASGIIEEVQRGLKRRLLNIIIQVDEKEEPFSLPKLNLETATPDNLIEYLKTAGIFSHIRQRPFNFLANPEQKPRHIFVKAIESAPFVPPPELQIESHEREFQVGLSILAKLTEGQVHLVYRSNTSCLAFIEAKHVKKHTAEGPHPVANVSLHIQEIAPIVSAQDCIWTLNVHDVILIGHVVLHGTYLTERVIGIGGPAAIEEKIGYFKVREGYPIARLIAGRVQQEVVRIVSGDVLTGHQVSDEDFLGFNDYCLSLIPDDVSREFLHFFRLGFHRYTFSKAYLSGHLNQKNREYRLTTSLHGEHRPFIDSTLYDKVMPLNISTMHLIKAILAEDYDRAAEFGLLEVDSEDFALPAFVCPSKMEMVALVKKGLKRYAEDILK